MVIEARELTKRYGDTTSVHPLSFTIAPGTAAHLVEPADGCPQDDRAV
jgi:ABC-2 type transport system ATP-binding protein